MKVEICSKEVKDTPAPAPAHQGMPAYQSDTCYMPLNSFDLLTNTTRADRGRKSWPKSCGPQSPVHDDRIGFESGQRSCLMSVFPASSVSLAKPRLRYASKGPFLLSCSRKSQHTIARYIPSRLQSASRPATGRARRVSRLAATSETCSFGAHQVLTIFNVPCRESVSVVVTKVQGSQWEPSCAGTIIEYSFMSSAGNALKLGRGSHYQNACIPYPQSVSGWYTAPHS